MNKLLGTLYSKKINVIHKVVLGTTCLFKLQLLKI